MRAQFSSATFFNRYPHIFQAAQQIAARDLPTDRPLRILSFGCSIGEEILSLRLHFPDAEIFGCDINQTVLASGAEIFRQADATAFLSTHAAIRDHGPFDIITAMSVLCRHPVGDIANTFPFSAFEDHLGPLDQSLSDHGLLIVYNASYLFRGTVLATRYRPLRADSIGSNGFVTRHGRASDPLAHFVYSDLDTTYRVECPDRIRFEDFIDCIHQKCPAGHSTDPEYVKIRSSLDGQKTKEIFTWSRKGVLNGLTAELPVDLMDTHIDMRLIEVLDAGPGGSGAQRYLEKSSSRRDIWRQGYRGRARFLMAV
ncbi:hypothetical protein GCM10009069_05000 [Algimonas arctica]|uniref:Methyltransferase domain-containing protein n=1 Tax=Algimonas arctica TaxID=1479486 RepID=A0A8J3CLV8_9PROT|nr:hypothetical protein [Algimonas arctica]GHA84880.1 hypothetical protein GCM10009069_05000 [Algimonas arctica]